MGMISPVCFKLNQANIGMGMVSPVCFTLNQAPRKKIIITNKSVRKQSKAKSS